jgi:hypothetical protein
MYGLWPWNKEKVINSYKGTYVFNPLIETKTTELSVSYKVISHRRKYTGKQPAWKSIPIYFVNLEKLPNF